MNNYPERINPRFVTPVPESKESGKNRSETNSQGETFDAVFERISEKYKNGPTSTDVVGGGDIMGELRDIHGAILVSSTGKVVRQFTPKEEDKKVVEDPNNSVASILAASARAAESQPLRAVPKNPYKK